MSHAIRPGLACGAWLMGLGLSVAAEGGVLDFAGAWVQGASVAALTFGPTRRQYPQGRRLVVAPPASGRKAPIPKEDSGAV